MKQMRQRIKNKTATFDRGCSDWISRAALFCFRRFPRRDLALRWRRFDSSANPTHTGRLPRSRRPSPASVINSPTKMWLERFSNRERPYSSDHAACTVAVHATYPKSGRAAVLGGPIAGVDRFRKRSGGNAQPRRGPRSVLKGPPVTPAGFSQTRAAGQSQVFHRSSCKV